MPNRVADERDHRAPGNAAIIEQLLLRPGTRQPRDAEPLHGRKGADRRGDRLAETTRERMKAGFFHPVLAHRRRCTRAPFTASAFQRLLAISRLNFWYAVLALAIAVLPSSFRGSGSRTLAGERRMR